MILLVYGTGFLKSAEKLPVPLQKKLATLLVIFEKNPFDPRLHTKYLSGPLAGFLSFRLNRDSRALFRFVDQETVHLLRVAHRKDMYR